MDCSPAGSSVHGILQARLLEWVPISSSRGYSCPTDLLHPLQESPALAGGFFTTEPSGKPVLATQRLRNEGEVCVWLGWWLPPLTACVCQASHPTSNANTSDADRKVRQAGGSTCPYTSSLFLVGAIEAQRGEVTCSGSRRKHKTMIFFLSLVCFLLKCCLNSFNFSCTRPVGHRGSRMSMVNTWACHPAPSTVGLASTWPWPPDPPFCLWEPPPPSPLKRSWGATAGLQGLSQGNHGHLLVEGQTWGRVSATFTNHRPGNPGFYQEEVSSAPCFVEKG